MSPFYLLASREISHENDVLPVSGGEEYFHHRLTVDAKIEQSKQTY